MTTVSNRGSLFIDGLIEMLDSVRNVQALNSDLAVLTPSYVEALRRIERIITKKLDAVSEPIELVEALKPEVVR